MNKTEQELLELIRRHPSPDAALETAILTLIDFLWQPLSFQEQALDDPREPF